MSYAKYHFIGHTKITPSATNTKMYVQYAYDIRTTTLLVVRDLYACRTSLFCCLGRRKNTCINLCRCCAQGEELGVLRGVEHLGGGAGAAGADVAVEVVLALDLGRLLPLLDWAVPTNTSDVRMSYAYLTHVVRTCK